ncbi:MAG: hypothetical protein K2H04_11405 [Bacteroidaceae bacterium]|nr:hypothetical protein [Bacteroidaceae bacterium]
MSPTPTDRCRGHRPIGVGDTDFGGLFRVENLGANGEVLTCLCVPDSADGGILQECPKRENKKSVGRWPHTLNKCMSS